jgi:hypothetical protein
VEYRLRIIQSNGDTELHSLSEKEFTIGSDASSNICLVGESKLLPKHILVAPRDDSCWISTARGAPIWDQEGRAVEGAFVPWGSRLSLGSCVFELQAVEISGDDKSLRNVSSAPADKPGESSKAPSPIIIMLLLCTLAYAALGFLGQPETMASKLPADPPELFDGEHSCSGKNAAHRARIAEDAAVAKSERAVFDKQDGVSAVELFATAEACYGTVQMTSDAKYVATRGKELREELNEEYKLLRMRLARALSEGDHALASSQLKQLLALLQHRSETDFVLSLRRLELQLSRKGLQP